MVALLAAGAALAVGCGATAGPSAGELVFELGDEPDAGTDGGRQVLPLDDESPEADEIR